MKDRRVMLKVKVKSLAEEARIIRMEERRTRGELKDELTAHRREVVRWHARTSHVAYGLTKGVPLEKIEQPKLKRTEEFWKAVRTMVQKYGPLDADEKARVLARCNG